MDFYTIFERLCNENGTTPTQIRKELKISQSTMASWKSRGLTPKGETLQKLADRFGVSADYLVGLRPLPDNLAEVFSNRSIGPNITALRKAVDLSQEELSEKTEIPLKCLKSFESGTGGYFPTEDDLFRIATVFGIKPEYIKGTSVTQEWMLDTMERNKKLQEDDPPVRNITFNVTPDPEWVELEKKMENGTITPSEVQRYKDLMEQGFASFRKSIPIMIARLQRIMEQLNDAGQQKLEDYARDLTRIPEYQREQPETTPQSTPAPPEGQSPTQAPDVPEKPTEGK